MLKYFLSCVIMAIGLVAVTTPAQATDQSTAVELCKKNPNCSSTRGPTGINIKVVTNDSWGEIYCPDKGECVCLSCSTTRTRTRDLGYIIKNFRVPESIVSGSNDGPPMQQAPQPSPGGGSGGPIIIN